MSRFDIAQARYDSAAPDDMPEIDGIEPQCEECGTVEWSLWQRGDSEQDPIYQCCKCGNKQEH